MTDPHMRSIYVAAIKDYRARQSTSAPVDEPSNTPTSDPSLLLFLFDSVEQADAWGSRPFDVRKHQRLARRLQRREREHTIVQLIPRIIEATAAGRTHAQIAADLNLLDVRTALNREWTSMAVRMLLFRHRHQKAKMAASR